MSRRCVLVILCTLLLGLVWPSSGAERKAAAEDHKGDGAAREKRSMPYWNLWSSDFIGWVEELRAQAGYDTIADLARTYWAHFPIANYLGYDDPEPEPESEPEE